LTTNYYLAESSPCGLLLQLSHTVNKITHPYTSWLWLGRLRSPFFGTGYHLLKPNSEIEAFSIDQILA